MRIEAERGDDGQRGELVVKGVSDAARAFAVHDFNAVGAISERAIDLVDNPSNRLLDAQAMEINTTRRRSLLGHWFCGPVLRRRSGALLFLAFRRYRQILLAAPDRDAFNAHVVAPVAIGLDDHSSLAPEGADDNVSADGQGHRGQFAMASTGQERSDLVEA